MDDVELEKAIKMINRVYKELYSTDQIVGNKNINDKIKNIESYIKKLDKIQYKLKKFPQYIDRIKQLFYDSYIIKPGEIEEKNYLKLIKTDYENGQKKIIITEELKNKYQKEIIENQKKSLDNWLNYFLSNETEDIPMWVKFWAFQGMLKLGTFNKETNTFNRRSKNNISKFPDLNKEAVKLSMIYIRKKIKKELIEDNELKELLKNGSFKRIYEYLLKELSSEQNKIFDGNWVRYYQGENFIPMLNSLQGYNTEWCITGYSTAHEQLREGDFYIYYIKDNKEEYKIPKIAIRMKDDSLIREICGVAQKQNIEEGYEEVIIKKIDSFVDKEIYIKGLNQLKKLTHIHKKFQNNKELTVEDLKFIYEIEENITGVVPNQDPRIKEILSKRDIRYDLSVIFNCKEEEIALSEEELLYNPNKIICLYDNLNLYDRICFPELRYIHGNINCPYEINAKSFKNLVRITGNMIFESLTDASDFTKLISIGKDAEFSSLKNSKGFNNLKSIGGNAYFPEIKEVYSFNNLISIGLNSFFPKYSVAYFPEIKNPMGLNKLRMVKGDLICDSLNTLDGFDSLYLVRGNLNIPLVIDDELLNIIKVNGKIISNKTEKHI